MEPDDTDAAIVGGIIIITELIELIVRSRQTSQLPNSHSCVFSSYEVVGVVRPAPTTSLSASEDVIEDDEARNFCWLPGGGHSSVQLGSARHASVSSS